MESDTYGVYTSYFTISKAFGAFPYNLDGRQQRLTLCTEGPLYWLYILNYIVATFHAFFQGFQLIFVFLEGADPPVIIGQVTWTLLGALPIANYIKWLGEERHYANIVNEWCLLERKIIGKFGFSSSLSLE